MLSVYASTLLLAGTATLLVMEDLQTMNGRLKAARLAHPEYRRSKTKLAKAVGVSRAVIGQWETGRTKNLKNEHMLNVCDVLNINVRWLITGKGPRNTPRTTEQEKIRDRWLMILEGLSPEQVEGALPLFEGMIAQQRAGLLSPPSPGLPLLDQ